MAVGMIFYKWSKKPNSTLRPDTDAAPDGYGRTTQVGEIKQPFDVLSLQLSVVPKSPWFTNPMDWSYVYINSLKRFYFISTWSFSQGIYTANCVCDVLASWKNEIGISTQYIMRSETGYNGDLVDSAYPTLPAEYVNFVYATGNPVYTTTLTACTYIIGVINKQVDNKIGCNKYYIMNYYAVASLLKSLLDDPDYLNISDVSEGLVKALFNPLEYITCAFIAPIDFNSFDKAGMQEEESFQFGWWGMEFVQTQHYKCYTMKPGSNQINGIKIPFVVPKHPQAADRGSYLNSSAYNALSLFIPPFGQIDLDCDIVGYANYVVANISFDMASRQAKVEVTVASRPNGAQTYVGQQTVQNFGIDLPMGSVTTSQNLEQAFSNVAAGAGYGMLLDNWDSTAVQGALDVVNFVGGAALGAAGYNTSEQDNLVSKNTMKSTVQNLRTLTMGGATVKSLGGSGGLLAYTHQIYLMQKYRILADENITEVGRPCCQRKVISTIPGYIQCGAADCGQIPALYSEKQLIEQYLNNGFHFE